MIGGTPTDQTMIAQQDDDVSMPEKVKRQRFAGFVADAATAAVLSAAFEPVFPQGSPFHVVDFRSTLKMLGRMVTPEILLVDLTGEDQPLSAMMSLAEVVEPGTIVLLVGTARDLSFYRAVVNGMGVKEYLAKPLTRETVVEHFLPFLGDRSTAEELRRGGKLIAITGARGGVGTTTIAANLSWAVGHYTHRHAILVDADLQAGTTALSLNVVSPGRGLVTALESPERVDKMLIERVAQPAGDRLHLLAAQEQFGNEITYTPGSCAVLTKALRQRYNFVIADTGARQLPFARDLLQLAHQRVIVLDPTILAIRNLERLNHLPGGSSQSPKAILVLNQAGRPFGMSQSAMEQNLGMKFDVVIPDLPRIVPKSAHYGEMAVSIRGPFRTAILQLADLLGAEAISEEKEKEKTKDTVAA